MIPGDREPVTRQQRGVAAAGFDIMTETGAGQPSYWRISPDDVQPVEAPLREPVVSFCQADERLRAVGRLSPDKARKWALRETGAPCRVMVNARAGVIYAAPVDWLDQFPHRVIPSLALLEGLVGAHRQQRTASATAGFLFAALTGPSLLILYAMDAQGAVGKPQITINPGNVEAILNAFAQMNSIELAGGENVLLFDNHDVLACYQAEWAYPAGEVRDGFASRTLRAGLLMATAACCLVGAGRYTLLLRQTAGVKVHAARLQRAIATLQQANDQLLLSHANSYARLRALDRKRLFAAANAVWQPGSVVRIDATDKAVNLAVEFRTAPDKAGRLMRVAAGTNAEALFSRAEKLRVPPGLQRTDSSVSGM